MNGKPKKLKGADGQYILPVTHAEFVHVDSDGKTLAAKLLEGGVGDGKSAYQTWLDLGNAGSEQDFINSLKGAKGDPGTATIAIDDTKTNTTQTWSSDKLSKLTYLYRGNKTGGVMDITEPGLYYVRLDGTVIPWGTGTASANTYSLLKVDFFGWTGAEAWLYTLIDRESRKMYTGIRRSGDTSISWKEFVYKEENPYRSTRLLLFGDSITATPYGRLDLVAFKTGCIVSSNAYAGSSISKRGDDGTYDNKSLVERTKPGTTFATDLSNIDNVLIFMGTNDAPRDGIGQINDGDSDGNYNEYTLYGALNKVVNNLYNQKNDINIMFVSPANTGFSDKTAMLAARDAVIAIANKYKYPCLNLTDEGGINDMNTYYRAHASDRKALLWDGLHPTSAGGSLMFSKIGAFASQHVRAKV